MAKDRLSVVFLGMTGPFSMAPLMALLHSGIDVRLVALAGSGPEQVIERRPAGAGSVGPILNQYPSAGIVQLSWAHSVPVLELADVRSPEAAEAIAGCQADVMVVACFPRFIPSSLRAAVRAGALNVHPSLLPRNRGPDPLFWTFKCADGLTGVSVHQLTDELDAGPVVAQRSFEVPDGIDRATLEQRCADIGGALLVETLRDFSRANRAAVTQDAAVATRHPMPAMGDYRIDWRQPARCAYNFVKGVKDDGVPIVLSTRAGQLTVADVAGWTEGEAQMQPGVAQVSMSPGTLLVVPAGDDAQSGDL